jgi:nucleoid DNA-binding protein
MEKMKQSSNHNFLKEKKMNKNELVDAMAANTGSTKVNASRAVAALTEIIAENSPQTTRMR